MRFLVFLLGIALASSALAQTTQKNVEKKKAAAKTQKKDEWGRFNAGAKKDLAEIEKKKAVKK